jgi:5,5'-dehydrodivanillate O-demethylase oxygenase subunit
VLTREENERLTRVGPGTPVGELMRRYWHPIAASSQLPTHGTKPVRVLGENLVLYRDRSGGLGLVAERCPHRRAGMLYGVPEAEGLRCAYHGWLFNAAGRCLEQPFEQADNPQSTFKDRIGIKAYPVEELAGLIFAYLGPAPTPLVPRWDLFALGDEVARDIGAAVIPCNWLQITENALDPVHVEWLHGHFKNYVFEKLGVPERGGFGKHEKIGFSVFEYGIIKRRVLEGENERDEDWATGHPLVFPMMLKSGSASHPTFQIRVPVDDEHTLHWWYTCHPPRPGQPVIQSDGIPYFDVPVPGVDAAGEPQWSLLDNNSGQDIAMWVTQGEVADREEEHLGASDRGVILYRQLLKENVERVARGEDPMNVFRDPTQNVCLALPVEEAKLGGRARMQPGQRRAGGATKYSPLLQALSEEVPAGSTAG